MKKVIYAIALISTFSAIFSCQKEDYNVSDLQTTQKLVTSQNPSGAAANSNQPIGVDNLLDVSCPWNVAAVGSSVVGVNCAEAALPCFTNEDGTIVFCPPPPPPPSTTVTITKYTSNGSALVTSFPVIAGQNSSSGNILISAVGGTITFSGVVRVQINVTSNGVIYPAPPFVPNTVNKLGCIRPIQTTKVQNFGIGTNCSVSF